MILNSISGSPVTDASARKSSPWQNLRAPAADIDATQRIGGAPEPDRADTRLNSDSAAEKNAAHHEDAAPVRFGAAGLPAFLAQDADEAGAKPQNSIGAAAEQTEGSTWGTAQRAGRMKYLVDSMRNASSQSQQAAQDGAEKAVTDQFRQAISAYGENSD